MKKSFLKNTALATVLATTLTACGGGSGGGAQQVITNVNNFVSNENFLSLSGAPDINQSFVSNVEKFKSLVSEISAYTPTDTDRSDAIDILNIIDKTIDDWNIVEDLLKTSKEITDKARMDFYEMKEYKDAVSSIKYLKYVARPIVTKVRDGETITNSEFKSVADKDTAQAHMTSYDAESATHVENKKAPIISKGKQIQISLTPEFVKEKTVTGPKKVDPGEWKYINGAGGKQEKTKTTTQTQTLVQTHNHCELTKFVYGDGTERQLTKVCKPKETEKILAPLVVEEKETQMGENAVMDSEDVSPEPLKVEEKLAKELSNTAKKVVGQSSDEREGSATTNTEIISKPIKTVVKDNIQIITYQKYEKTTTTLPVTTDNFDVVDYTYTWKEKKRWKTTTYDWVKETYADKTDNVIKNADKISYSGWTEWISKTEETKKELTGSAVVDKITIKEEPIGNSYTEETPLAFTDKDQNLGTKTENISTVVADHKTYEYKSNSGLNMINVADAYARGWTGKGAVLGVIDTWQDTTHAKLKDKYLYYKNYDTYQGKVKETQNHGTKVASIIAGSRDGDSFNEDGRLTTGDYDVQKKWLNGNSYNEYNLTKNNNMHGVAFDSKLVGANVDRYSNGWIAKGQAQYALHDFAKLKSPKSEGGEEMNIVAVNMSFNTPHLFYNGWNQNDSTVTQLDDGTYNASEIISKIQANGSGDAKYWKIATDNDIILVNSAGNMGYSHAGDPGIWAVEEDANGNLILGGKMVIVGSWDGTGISGNKAGHVCLKIDTANNTCNDKHRLNEFYILAPGVNIMGADPGNGFSASSGTSFAAPHVTGAFGVLHQMWPYMKGENLVKLVMNTADKSLPNYNVNIHGQGLLDLNEATKPQGAVGIVTTGRVDHPVVDLKNTYFSTGTALPSSLSNLKIMVLDDYDRNYYMDIGSSFVVQDKRKVSDIEQMANGYVYMPVNQMYGSYAQGGQYDLGYMNFGLFTGEGGNGDYSANIGKKYFISDKLAISGNIGQMKEQETWLGNKSDGILSVGDDNTTKFSQLGVSYQIGNNVLSLDYSKGSTDINTVDNSLITGFSDVKTESYRLAYEMHKDENNTLGWSFSLPSHITSGSMNMEVAESVNLDGSINYNTINSDLTQKHKEKNIGFFYTHTPEHELDSNWKFTAEYRQDIAGVAGNDGVNLGMNYVKKFWGACGFLWMKNPKCYNEDGSKKDMKSMIANNGNDQLTKHGLVYDMKTDKFVPIDSKDNKWKK